MLSFTVDVLAPDGRCIYNHPPETKRAYRAWVNERARYERQGNRLVWRTRDFYFRLNLDYFFLEVRITRPAWPRLVEFMRDLRIIPGAIQDFAQYWVDSDLSVIEGVGTRADAVELMRLREHLSTL